MKMQSIFRIPKILQIFEDARKYTIIHYYIRLTPISYKVIVYFRHINIMVFPIRAKITGRKKLNGPEGS